MNRAPGLVAWSLSDTARLLRLEDELRQISPERGADDRFYDIIHALTGSKRKAERYLYKRVEARTRAEVLKKLHQG